MRLEGAVWSGLAWLAQRPTFFFFLMSISCGLPLVAAAPPLRGPDETAHFIRAYGIGRGDFIPTTVDTKGRKGVFLPQPFYRQFSVFDAWQRKNRGDNFSYRRVFNEYALTDVEADDGN